MKIINYLKKYILHCVAIFCLLVLQTALILSSPLITSNIINIGLQQKGINSVVSPYYSRGTYQQIIDVMPNLTQHLQDAYDYDEGLQHYTLKPDYDKSDTLNDLLVYPMAYLEELSENNHISFEDYKNATEKDVAQKKAIQNAVNELERLNINTFEIQLNYLLNQGGILIFITICLAIITYFCQVLIAYVSIHVGKEKRQKYFDKLIQFSYEEINKIGEASLITRATNDISYITDYVRVFLDTVFTAPINLLVGMIFAIITAPNLTWIIILSAIAIIVAAFVTVRFAAPIFWKLQCCIDLIALKSREIISGQYTIRSFNNEKFEEYKFGEANRELQETNLFLGKLMAIITTLLTLGFNIVSLVILLLGGYYINAGELQVGSVIAFVSYSLIILASISSLGMFIGSMPRAKICMNRIDEVIQTSPKIKSTGNIKIDKVEKIEFKNVCYLHNESKNMVLKDVSFEINTGETLGIIGTIGSGKSTIVNLLMRLEDASEGEILINNKDIKQCDLNNYKNLFGFSPQNSFLFKGTFKDNIAFGTNRKIDKYIEFVCLEELIDSLENGIDSNIEQYGHNISGGQQQRISIARALATNAPVLIFDDCFSSLDYEIERKIFDNIVLNFPNNIKIIISSRLSSIRYADKILVLDEGKIVGYGKHNSLMNNCAEYIKLYKYQYPGANLKGK